jgi:hypothetical protein
MTRARRAIDLATTKAELQALVVDLAHTHDWRVTATSIPGWPAIVLLGHNRALFIELKSETGRVRPEQREVIGHLRAAGLDARIWRPSDWPSIEATLTGGRT